jgi:hypothetical protein
VLKGRQLLPRGEDRRRGRQAGEVGLQLLAVARGGRRARIGALGLLRVAARLRQLAGAVEVALHRRTLRLLQRRGLGGLQA